MRSIAICLAAVPLPVLAETFTLNTAATSAIVYGSSATVTHDTSVTLPAGAHELVLPDLPTGVDIESLRVAAPDLKLGAIRYRTDRTPPRIGNDSPEIIAAEDRITEIENQIQDVKDRAARQELAIQAAETRIGFLAGLKDSETLPTDSTSLRDLAQMIGDEALTAQQDAFDAKLAARKTREVLEDLQEDLEDAKAALDALIPEADTRPLLVMDVIVAEPVTDAPLAVSFLASAGWQPTYDLRLTDGPNPQIIIERGASVEQFTGENWKGIQLTVSTQTPSDQTDPFALQPDLRRIFDQDKFNITARAAPAPRALTQGADLVVEAASLPEEASMGVSFGGLSVAYTYSDPVDVAHAADAVRLPFDSITLDAELVARAVPLNHHTAFLVAKITNTSGEPLLATDQVLRFFDGVLVGSSYLATIEAGAEAEIGFGSIDGLQLTRRILKRDEGDRGIITRSNEKTEEIEITLKNLTDRTWNVELRDRVPYSEQEDLEITYRTSPEPDVTGVDDKRGVLQWNIEMPPGKEGKVSHSHRITWPEGQTLR